MVTRCVPHVLLLGGPNSFIRGMKEAWQQNIPKMWEERKVEIPAGVKPEDLIKVPENAQYFAAIGAVEFGKDEDPDVGIYLGTECLEDYISVGRQAEKAKSGSAGLSASEEELTQFKQQYTIPKFVGAKFTSGETVHGFIGIDGGSTSTKAVLLSQAGDVLCKAYQLSNGNPIQDTIDMFAAIRDQVESQGASLDVLGIGTTGYAKDVLKDVLKADVALVETVAHTESAMKFYKNPHVIVDVGGQDIKLIVLERRPRQGLQAKHAMLGRQRILSCRARPRLWATRSSSMPTLPLRHRLCRSSVTDARCSCSRTSSIFSARAGEVRRSLPDWPPFCQRTSSFTWLEFRT